MSTLALLTRRFRFRPGVVLCLCTVAALSVEPLAAPQAQAQAACITGTPGNDVLIGTEGDDCIVGLGGDDDIFGNGGNDRIAAGDGDDVVYGGAGGDKIDGGPGHDAIDGDDGSDDVSGGTGDDDIDGLGGDDRISGGAGDDYLVGGEDGDSVAGGDGDDLLDDAFDEPLETAGSNDALVGGAGDDELLGGPGADRLDARDGLPQETTDGGEGADVCMTDGDLVSNCEPTPLAGAAPAAVARAAGVTAARRSPLRVPAITWNVHERRSNDQQIADVLADAVGRGTGDLKVAGLQEMCFNQVNDIVESNNRLEEQTGRNWSWETSLPYGNDLYPAVGRCDNGNVVLASVPDTSIERRFKKRFDAQEDDKCPGSGYEKECRNYVRLDADFGGRTIRLYSVHIGGPASVKAAQIRELASDIRNERQVIPRIVMGDFNVSPGNSALRPMRRLFRDVLGRRNVPTENAGPCPSSGNRIDYIFVRRIRVDNAYVPRMSDDRNVSDHCPVVAKLRVP